MAQGSCPESTRSLPNRHLKVCDVSLLKCPALDFHRRSALEEEFHSLPQVVTRLLDGVALACDVQLGTKGHVAPAFTVDDRGKVVFHDISLVRGSWISSSHIP